MNHTDVAHHWAHQTKESGNGPNMFFEGRSIYSYGTHFEIARLMERKHNGETVCLFTEREYSVTTSGHKSIVRQALNSDIVFNVVEMTDGTVRGDKWSSIHAKEAHRKNLANMLEQYEEALVKHARARKYDYTELAENWLLQAKKYTQYFKCTSMLPSKYDWVKDDAKFQEACTEIEQLAHEAADRREEAERREAERNKEAVQDWLVGKRQSIIGLNTRTHYLRVREGQIETSLGVKVPMREARVLFQFVVGCMRKQEAWVSNGQTMTIGGWSVNRIEANGTLRAGCHLIKFEQQEYVAKQAGWIN
jgi:hypothetical protein